jgi:PAS domain S-box-containing protein
MSNSEPLNALQSDQIFRRLVDSVQDYAIFLLTPEGNIASWTPGAERLKRYRPHEIIGKHFSIFYPDYDVASGKPAMELREAAKHGRFEDEGWRIRRDGTRFWANVVITAIRGEDGELIGFGKITRDLTERREAEVRYRLLIEGVTDYAIFSLDPSGNVTSWNSGAERIKGYSGEEIIGQHFSKFYSAEDSAAGLPTRILETAATTGHYEGEGWRLRKDGTRFWSSVVITPLRDEGGNLLGFSKITRDVTDRKRLLDKIQQHAEELELRIAEREQTNAELEAFSYSVSHDLRAPLRAIEGFTDIVLTDFGNELSPQVTDYLQQVLQSAARMNLLVQDLLSYSRLTRMELQPEAVNVSSAIRDACMQIEETQRKHVAVSVDKSLRVSAHRSTLTQILLNLINNGLKFYSPGAVPKVAVSAKREGKRVMIAVRDQGIGIAPQHQQRIFKVFERLHTTAEYPGTGIGLAIVHRGVARMGGSVRLESAPGKGSTFYIDLVAA